jgi:hypothetical protein
MSKDERLKIVLAIMIVIVTTLLNRINNNNILTNKTKNHGKYKYY